MRQFKGYQEPFAPENCLPTRKSVRKREHRFRKHTGRVEIKNHPNDGTSLSVKKIVPWFENPRRSRASSEIKLKISYPTPDLRTKRATMNWTYPDSRVSTSSSGEANGPLDRSLLLMVSRNLDADTKEERK